MLNKKIAFSYVVQILFSLAALVTTFLSYYDELWIDVTILLVSATFFIIGYNYYTLKNEKKMALVYFLLSIGLIILMLFRVI
jgi:hypothetical protein